MSGYTVSRQMTEIELNQADKDNLNADIKLTLIFSFLFCLALVVIVGILPLTMYIFGASPADGFVSRGLQILSLLFLPFLFISWKNILKYFDLKHGKKFRFETSNYQIIKERDSVMIRTSEPRKLKFKVCSDVDTRININRPVTIEFVQKSQTILFISNDQTNTLF